MVELAANYSRLFAVSDSHGGNAAICLAES
jgi:hypothetical protein